VPTVYLVHKGNAVDAFTGMPQQAALDNFLANVQKATGSTGAPNELEVKTCEFD
jgi:thioredoxin-like negative regulator of GroEL